MKKLTLLIGLLFGITSIKAQAVLPAQSKVSFEISNLLVNTVEGSFSGLKGTVKLNTERPNQSKFEVCLDPATINTANEKRDDHLRNEDFFWVEKHPSICFTGTKFIKLANGKWKIEGQMEIRGVTNTITVELVQNGKEVNCTFVVNRLDYEVGMDYGSFSAGEEVNLKVKLQIQ